MKKTQSEATESQKSKGGRLTEKKIRMTEAEFYAINEKAYKSGKAFAIYVRDAALQKEIKAQLTPQQVEAYVANRQTFTKLSYNLHQLLRAVEKEGLMKYAVKVEGLIKEIDEKLKK